jgi:hypothetical protein
VTHWTLRETEEGLRLIPGEQRRKFGSERLSWMELLYRQLAAVRVFVLFFPSRFDQPTDMQVMEALRRFGSNAPADTSVNFWGPRGSGVRSRSRILRADVATGSRARLGALAQGGGS